MDITTLSAIVSIISTIILLGTVIVIRLQRNSGEYWDDYEWLAGQAKIFRKTTNEKPQ
jgi:hypothetical protein